MIRRFSPGPSGASLNWEYAWNGRPSLIAWHARTIAPLLRWSSLSSPVGILASIKSRSGAPCPTGGNWCGSPINRTDANLLARRRLAIKSTSIIDDSSTITYSTLSGLCSFALKFQLPVP